MTVLPADTSINNSPESILTVDPQRVETLQTPYREFKRRAGLGGFWQTARSKVEWNFQPYYFYKPPKWRVLARSMTSSRRMMPSFASIGAVRSGTSFLSSYIFQHPHMVLPLAKEISFPATMRELMAYFPSHSAQRAAQRENGGAITGYCTPIMPNLLWIFLAKSMFPNLRVVVVLRDPVERVFSHWRWDQQRSISHKIVDLSGKGSRISKPLLKPNKKRSAQVELESQPFPACARDICSTASMPLFFACSLPNLARSASSLSMPLNSSGIHSV